MNRREAYRQACELIVFAIESDDPSADLIAIGWALRLIGNDLRGKPAAEQRALIMAAQMLADSKRESGECYGEEEGYEVVDGEARGA